MTTTDLFQALMPVLKAFEGLSVEYYVGSSVASSAFGLPRSTLDVDLVAALEAGHVDDLVAELADEFYVSAPMIRDAIDRESSFNLIHLATMFKVDIFVPQSRPFELSALS